MARYVVIQAAGLAAIAQAAPLDQDRWAVIDLEASEVLCLAPSRGRAERIADALNGDVTDQARRALTELHVSLDRAMGPDAEPVRWADRHAPGVCEYVGALQHAHEVPF